MRIIIASAVYYPMTNGVAVFAYNLANGLAKKGHEVMVICPSFTGKRSIRKKDGVTLAGLSSIRLPVYPDQISKIPEKKKLFGRELPRILYNRGIWVSPAPGLEIRKIIKKFKPDVIHSQTSDPIGVAVAHFAKEFNIPFVTTGHNYPDQLTGQMKLGPMKKPVDAVLAAYLANYRAHSDYTTMPTEMAIEDLMLKKRKKFEIPVEALSNGVDLDEFKPGKVNLKIYNKFKLPTDRPIVLYVGRVDPTKSISMVVEAFAAVLEKVPEALLVVVGDGTDVDHLKTLVKYLQIEDSVRFLGKIMLPELASIYRAGSVFVTASETETQGIVLIEAAASGLPIVAVDSGAVKEVCKNNENGFLCQPKNTDEIAEGIAKILENDDLRTEFSKASVEIAKKHDFRYTLKRFEEIYNEAIELRNQK